MTSLVGLLIIKYSSGWNGFIKRWSQTETPDRNQCLRFLWLCLHVTWLFHGLWWLMLKAYVDSIFQCRLEASASRQYLHTTLRWLVTKSPLNLTIKCTESGIRRHKPLETIAEQFAYGHVYILPSNFFFFSLICMYHPIRIISVTALNIFNSKDAVGVGEEVAKGLRVPVGAACFPGLPLCQVFDIDWSWRWM